MISQIDRNAATRYLYAIAWLAESDISPTERNQISQLSRGEVGLSQLSNATKRYLRNWKLQHAISALIKGSSLKFCNFCPDHPNYYSKAFPPMKEIFRLGENSLAFAEFNASNRRFKSAVEIGIANIILGVHIAQYSDALIFMNGVRVSKNALSFLSRFSEFRPHWKKEIQRRIRPLPRPLFSAKSSLIAEKRNLLLHLKEIEGILKPNSYLRRALKAAYCPEKFPIAIRKLSSWANSSNYSSDRKLLIRYVDSVISFEQDPSQYTSSEHDFKLLFSMIDKDVGHGPVWHNLLHLYKLQADIENRVSELLDE